MNLPARKLKVIQYLAGLRDENALKKIESTIVEVQKQHCTDLSLKAHTKSELIERARRSTRDYNAGNIVEQEHLEKESENW